MASSEIIEMEIGDWKYQQEYRKGLGTRINWHSKPPVGTKVIDPTHGLAALIRIGQAGKMECRREDNGHEFAAWPSELTVAS